MNFDGKTVLVTGGAGFIGSELVRQLIKENANVIVYDNMLIGDESNLNEIKNDIKIIRGDIRDKNLKEVFLRNDVEFVFNLAAEPYIPHCYERPAEFFSVNANGAMNVMLACKEAGVKRVMQYSTSEVYGTARYIPMDENHHTNPMSTYAVSKLAADRLCFTLHREQNIPIITLRQFNCYGPRETQPYVIPEIISQLSKSNKLMLGNIKARRDFTFVEDAARAAILLMKKKKAEGEIFNVGFGEDYSIEEIAYIIAELMGRDSVKITIDPKRLRPLDVERLQCNYFKLHKLTGWKPKINLREGLQRTIDWFNENGRIWMWEKKIAPAEKVWRN
jgi:dTDP-glucose 4,6-dehydratase